MIRRKLFIFCSTAMLAVTFSTSAQVALPTVKKLDPAYYRQPMDGRMLLSANFAEARTNHLHSGIDIKTGGVEGRPIYAIADGDIVRIGVAPGGFGRVLYLNHPNGTSSTYAHMQKFTPEIEKYLDDERHRLRRHNVDLYPEAGTFRVKQGDLIGWSGNSGSSGGPHLHFEIRETASQRPLNVAAQKVYDLTDNLHPRIVRLHYVEVDSIGNIPLHSRPQAIEVRNVSPGVYAPVSSTPFTVGPRGYFVLEATDRKNDTDNTMGIYSVRAKLDDNDLFGFTLDGFLFSDTRYVNSLNHYELQRGSRNELLRMAVADGNRLAIYHNTVNRGLVMLSDSLTHILSVEAFDDNGNSSRVVLPIRLRADERKFYDETALQGVPLDHRKAFSNRFGALEVNIPANTLYESVFYTIGVDERPLPSGGNTGRIPRYSSVYRIQNKNVPMHSAMSVSITPDDVPQEMLPYLCLGALSDDGTAISYAGGKHENGKVTGNLNAFGRYMVVADTIPPTITPSFADGANLRNTGSVSFTMRDNFSGIASFSATIDGQWIALEQKTTRDGKIVHNFDPARIGYNGGRHTMEITVTDNRGNRTTVTRTFIK